MAPMISPTIIGNELGQSVIYEDYWGDFAQAASAAVAALDKARREGGAASPADALLARGVAHWLQESPTGCN